MVYTKSNGYRRKTVLFADRQPCLWTRSRGAVKNDQAPPISHDSDQSKEHKASTSVSLWLKKKLIFFHDSVHETFTTRWSAQRVMEIKIRIEKWWFFFFFSFKKMYSKRKTIFCRFCVLFFYFQSSLRPFFSYERFRLSAPNCVARENCISLVTLRSPNIWKRACSRGPLNSRIKYPIYTKGVEESRAS